MRAPGIATIIVGLVTACSTSNGDSESGSSTSTTQDGVSSIADPAPLTTPESSIAAVATTTRPTTTTIGAATGETLAPSALLPSRDIVDPDLDENCGYLYELVSAMALGPYYPYIAKGIGRDDGTGITVGCEMYFDDEQGPGAFGNTKFSISWSSVPLPHRQPTNDLDETSRTLSSGSVALVDPTGDDGQGYDDVRVVSVVQPDGSIAFVMGMTGTSLELTVAVADEFDQALRAVA